MCDDWLKNKRQEQAVKEWVIRSKESNGNKEKRELAQVLPMGLKLPKPIKMD